MAKIIRTPTRKVDMYGRVLVSTKQPTDFTHLLGQNYNDIVPFDNGTDAMLEQDVTILPRHFYLFIGTKDDKIQFKPYEFDQYRIVISTRNNIIVNIDSIG